VTPNWAAVTL